MARPPPPSQEAPRLAHPSPSGRRIRGTTQLPDRQSHPGRGGLLQPPHDPGADRGGFAYARLVAVDHPRALTTGWGAHPPDRERHHLATIHRCEVLEESGRAPPGREGGSGGAMVNGWAFNFQESTQVVARQMALTGLGAPGRLAHPLPGPDPAGDPGTPPGSGAHLRPAPGT